MIGELEGLTARYLLREHFWEQLMHALYRSGRQAEALSDDGGRLATGSLDGTARVWKVNSGEVVFTSPVESSDIKGVAFSKDGSRVAVIYSNGRIIVHAITLDDVIEIAWSSSHARICVRGVPDVSARFDLPGGVALSRQSQASEAGSFLQRSPARWAREQADDPDLGITVQT